MFHTKYNLPKRVFRKLSTEDKVDRLSFVDSTVLVKRFISEGKNLAMSRAHALYESAEEALTSSDSALPLYREDQVFTDARIDSLESELSSRLKERSVVESLSKSDSSKADYPLPADNVSGAAEVNGN